MKAKFLGVEVEYDPGIFRPDLYPKRKPGQCCGVCDCYTVTARCNWGFRLKRKPDDWCFQFGGKQGGGE